MAAATAGWSSLPSDLINRIADCLIATNDIDYYMDFRAVCSNWRSATTDPKNTLDLRFRPRQWIDLDEVFENNTRALVNTATGRVVRKELPMLRNYYVIATTAGGFFVLADSKYLHDERVLNPFTGHLIRFRTPVPLEADVAAAVFVRKELPMLRNYYVIATTVGGFFVLSDRKYLHAARVLNPFTGHLIRFRTPVPLEQDVAAAVFGPKPTLILISDRSRTQYRADPASECYTEYVDQENYPMVRLAVLGGMYADGEDASVPQIPDVMADKILNMMGKFGVQPLEMYPDDLIDFLSAYNPQLFPNRCFLVKFAGEVFVIFKLKHHIDVFKMDTDRDLLEPVKSIGNLAVFIGYRRCLAVNAEKFTSIEANCIYYIRSIDRSIHIYKFDLQDMREERVSQAIDSLEHIAPSYTHPPFTIIQLISSYTVNVRISQLVFARMHEGTDVRTDGDKVPYDLEDLNSLVESMVSFDG